MSTFKIEGAKFLEELFPEWNWKELTNEKYEEVFQKLTGIEDLQNEVIQYIKAKRIKIGFHQQYKSGGGWTFLRTSLCLRATIPLTPMCSRSSSMKRFT